MMTPHTLHASKMPHKIQWKNGERHYGLISQVMHWSTAVLIVLAIALGLYSASMERVDPARDAVIALHKSIGLVSLILVSLRFVWIWISRAPALPSALALWERVGAKAAHYTLYGLMLLMPLTGLMLSQSAGREVSLFGLLTLPQLIPFDPAIPPAERPLVIAGALLHKTILETVLYVVLGLHVLGVLKHRFVDGDRHYFGRMWNFGKW